MDTLKTFLAILGGAVIFTIILLLILGVKIVGTVLFWILGAAVVLIIIGWIVYMVGKAQGSRT